MEFVGFFKIFQILNLYLLIENFLRNFFKKKQNKNKNKPGNQTVNEINVFDDLMIIIATSDRQKRL